MAIKTILVHIDNSPACESRVDTAIQLAKQHDAGLTCIHVIPDFPIPTFYEAQLSEVAIEIDKQALKWAKLIERKYLDRATKAGVLVSSAIEQGNLVSVLDQYARFADLLVLGESNPDGDEFISENLIDNLVIEAGTPCLIVPHSGCGHYTARRVLVAWNATREAARALRDAMPILAKAEHVELLQVNPARQDADDTPGKSILLFLSRHGIKSELQVKTDNKVQPTEAIMARASAIQADTVVMGAYGHSRLREIVLGGVSRQLIREMTIPVFMSH